MASQASAPNVRAFDAVYLLGFGLESPQPLPDPEPGTIVIRYGGWSLLELRQKRRALFHGQDWYDKYPWATEKLPSGIYVLRLPVPESNRKTFDEQRALLLPNEEHAPVVLAASALLSIRLSNQLDPLKSDWARCKEQADAGDHVMLSWRGGRLSVYSVWVDSCRERVWFAGFRRTS